MPLPIETREALQAAFERQRAAFAAHPYPSAGERRRQLDALAGALRRHQARLADAVALDFDSRSRDETRLLELFPALESLRHARRRLGGWMRDERRRPSIWYRPARLRVAYQPKGVVGVIVPWNYPLFLALGPLIGALAAGNRVLVKMSEYTPRTARALADALAECFETDAVAVVAGDADLARAFAALPFDHLLFTGSTAVGRQVMAAAGAHLTPVTLELGGKSPVIVDESYPLERAVERILHGKCLNAGQTCIAPDYALLPAGQEARFVELARAAVARWYPGLADNADYSSVIDERHRARLAAWLDEARAAGARVIELAEGRGRRMPPTLVLGDIGHLALMREEIFGPVLPLLPYRRWEEALDFVRARPRPLALYYFGDDRGRRDELLRHTHSGGLVVNDTLLHAAQEALPFGGIGEAGMGHYHGREGFLTFSHAKAVLEQGRWSSLALFRPPYRRWMQWFLDRVL